VVTFIRRLPLLPYDLSQSSPQMFIKPLHMSLSVSQGIVVRPTYDDWIQAVSDLIK